MGTLYQIGIALSPGPWPTTKGMETTARSGFGLSKNQKNWALKNDLHSLVKHSSNKQTNSSRCLWRRYEQTSKGEFGNNTNKGSSIWIIK